VHVYSRDLLCDAALFRCFETYLLLYANNRFTVTKRLFLMNCIRVVASPDIVCLGNSFTVSPYADKYTVARRTHKKVETAAITET
jgi:hypothetical protein